MLPNPRYYHISAAWGRQYFNISEPRWIGAARAGVRQAGEKLLLDQLHERDGDLGVGGWQTGCKASRGAEREDRCAVKDGEGLRPGADAITPRRGRSQMPREGVGDRLKHIWKQRLSRLLW